MHTSLLKVGMKTLKQLQMKADKMKLKNNVKSILPCHKNKPINRHWRFFLASTFNRNVSWKVKYTVSAFIFVLLQLLKEFTVSCFTRPSNFNINHLFIFNVIDYISVFFVFLHFFIDSLGSCWYCYSRRLKYKLTIRTWLKLRSFIFIQIGQQGIFSLKQFTLHQIAWIEKLHKFILANFGLNPFHN